MRLPRIIFGAGYIKLWQMERRENVRLRRERDEWANKVLQLKNVQPLFTPPPKFEPVERPPVGQIAKNQLLARQREEVNHPTAEQTLNVH